jgi:hypothetical protein
LVVAAARILSGAAQTPFRLASYMILIVVPDALSMTIRDEMRPCGVPR